MTPRCSESFGAAASIRRGSARRRVLFVVKQLSSGGVITHMMSLAEGLIAKGWTVAVCSRGQVGVHPHGPAWFETRGVRHFTVDFPRTTRVTDAFLHAPRALAQITAAVRVFTPDLLHVHFRSVSPFARAIEAINGVPFVSTLHLAGIRADRLYRVGSFWGRHAIAVSSDTEKFLARVFRIRADKIRLVYNGADASHFRPPTDVERVAARTHLSIPADVRVVSIVGRLAPVKGHEVLFRALRALGNDRKVLALLAGSGDAASVERQAREAGVEDRVRLLGHTDTRRVLWASDVSVLPSLQEGFGLVTVEAMLCGVVPVRTPAAGASDQIDDGVNGFIVPFRDATALADRLARLFDDDVTRHRMSAAALSRGRERFTTERMTARTIEVYEETLRGQRTATPRDAA